MNLADAQRELRTAYRRGSVGQLVTAVIWLASAGLAAGVDKRLGIIALLLGGTLIFPLTQMALRIRGGWARPSPENPLPRFFLQGVFAMVALYPLVYVAALHNVNWFYPAFMIVVGVHYMSFVLLYGMWEYGLLAALLVGSGVMLAILLPDVFSAGGWVTAIVLMLFGLVEGRFTDAAKPVDASSVARYAL
jgi:cellulose synthase/poly-beta-1,6-N-acetylglucosamine synthase-like glycosyltransferase